MGAFEFKKHEGFTGDSGTLNEVAGISENCSRDHEDCIIAMKVYDSCRQQLCLNGDDLGPARAARDINFGNLQFRKGEVITPPSTAVSVMIDNFRIDKIIIVNKSENSFMRGYWNIDVRFVFLYDVIFQESNGSTVGPIPATSIFNTRVTLFGSSSVDLVFATDLFTIDGEDSTTLTSDPYVVVEASAVVLSADIKNSHCFDVSCFTCGSCGNESGQVEVTIGLFAIYKLIRIVNLSVESKGFCIPPECCEAAPVSPCDFFDNLDFPMDIFAPPTREQLNRGVSNNISSDSRDRCRECDE